MKKIRVNMVSESDITVQGHGVHTAYVELADALDRRDDVTLIRGDFGHQTDCDIVHLHTFGPRVWRKLSQPHVGKVVSAHVVPASLVGSIILAKYWLPLATLYMRWYYNKADKVLAVSNKVAEVLHDDLRVPKNKIEVFYNAIDMKRYQATAQEKRAARTRLGIPKDDFMVLGNGQVQPRKRLDTFVAMAKAMPDVRFVWVGGIPFKRLGADYDHMKQLMDTVPANVEITGVIPHEKVRDYLLAANVFCLPAEQENHPMCVLEAAGAGLPIVLRDIKEYDDTFRGDALLCATDEEFIAAVTKLRENNVFYKQQQAGTQMIAKRFDSHAAAERLVNLYRQLI